MFCGFGLSLAGGVHDDALLQNTVSEPKAVLRREEGLVGPQCEYIIQYASSASCIEISRLLEEVAVSRPVDMVVMFAVDEFVGYWDTTHRPA